jgi:hypothetical protein
MDTIMHVKSLNLMVNIVKDFEQVTLDHVRTESEYCQNLFDDYDRDNDTTARLYLENSLDPTLSRELVLRQEVDDSAAVTWMRILRLVSDGLVERFNFSKEELKALSPTKEPGESILEYSNKARRICRELDRAQQFDWILVLSIVKALCHVSVESFRAMWHPKRIALDAVLSDCAFLSKVAAKKVLIKEGYHYSSIRDKAEEAYKSLLEN